MIKGASVALAIVFFGSECSYGRESESGGFSRNLDCAIWLKASQRAVLNAYAARNTSSRVYAVAKYINCRDIDSKRNAMEGIFAATQVFRWDRSSDLFLSFVPTRNVADAHCLPIVFRRRAVQSRLDGHVPGWGLPCILKAYFESQNNVPILHIEFHSNLNMQIRSNLRLANASGFARHFLGGGKRPAGKSQGATDQEHSVGAYPDCHNAEQGHDPLCERVFRRDQTAVAPPPIKIIGVSVIGIITVACGLLGLIWIGANWWADRILGQEAKNSQADTDN